MTETYTRKQPNLLFVLADEHRRQCMGFARDGDPVATPHFDAFARQAATFHNAMVEVPVCSPSRATLFTGLYAMHHGLHRLGAHMLKGAERNDLFSILKQHGYHIGYIGKWHITTYPEHQWRQQMLARDPEFSSRVHKGPFGIEYRMGKYVPPVGRPHIDYWISGNNGSNFWQQVLFRDDPDQPEITYEWEVDCLARKGIEYLRDIRDKSKPFACFVSINPPHPGTEHDREGRVVRFNVNVAPPEWEEPYRHLKSTGRPNFTGDEATFVEGYFGAVSSLDHAFGQLLQTLQDIGEYENTIIVYTSDHGDLVGSHGCHAKSVWYEESIGVPLLIGWPGVIRPSSHDILFSNVHLMPTLLGLMGLPIPEGRDGQDFSPLLRGGSVDEPEEEPIAMMPTIKRLSDEDYGALGTVERVQGSPSWWGEWRGIRTRRHTYAIQYHHGRVHRHLYDNLEDPYQMHPIEDSALWAEFDARVQRWLHPQDPFPRWVGWI